jgi:hypothetical protein
MHFVKIDEERTTECLRRKDKRRVRRDMRQLQNTVYVMVGGGMLGASAARQPQGFYVDSRCSKRPYPNRSIMQAVKVLELHAIRLGLDPTSIPDEPGRSFMDHHNCGVF